MPFAVHKQFLIYQVVHYLLPCFQFALLKVTDSTYHRLLNQILCNLSNSHQIDLHDVQSKESDMMILLSLPVKFRMYDILLLVYQDAATQEFLFQFHHKDLIFLAHRWLKYYFYLLCSNALFTRRCNAYLPRITC